MQEAERLSDEDLKFLADMRRPTSLLRAPKPRRIVRGVPLHETRHSCSHSNPYLLRQILVTVIDKAPDFRGDLPVGARDEKQNKEDR